MGSFISGKRLVITASAMLFSSFAFGQTVEKYFETRNFKEMVKFEDKAANLSAYELYLVGYAFFELENDAKAIEFYDRSLRKEPGNATAHFYKGLALRLQQKYNEAMNEVETAIKAAPTNQEFVNEKGVLLYYQNEFDKALTVFQEAIKLPKTYTEPYFWIARIYHEREDFDKALAAFYEAVENLSKDNSYYFSSLVSIGQLEFAYTKNFAKSAAAYAKALEIDPQNFMLHPKLMKSYNEAGEYKEAEKVFKVMQTAFMRKELPKDDMESGSATVDEYYWNGQRISINRPFNEPEKILDAAYRVYLLNKKGDKIERRFIVEKTAENADGAKFLLCEFDKTKQTHYTFPYGWKTDHIPLGDLKKAIDDVLTGKLMSGASSSPNSK